MKSKSRKIKIEFVILLLIFFSITSYEIGFYNGAKKMVDWGVDKAMYFLELKGITIDINENLIKEGVLRYKNNIGGCWNIENQTN